MPVFNTQQHYGALTKIFHWLVVILFAFQYAAGYIMLSLAPKQTALGLTSSNYFNWHKSIGLIVLAVVILRLINRTVSRLPDLAPGLTAFERRAMHIYETLLYVAMFFMPITGYIYVMAGGYGVYFLEWINLPNPIGKWAELAFIAKWSHIGCSYVILAALAAHMIVVFRHQLISRDGLLWRMLPGRRS